MVVRLIRVGNNPGFWKVGVENTLWWLVAKCLLVEAFPESRFISHPNEAYNHNITVGVPGMVKISRKSDKFVTVSWRVDLASPNLNIQCYRLMESVTLGPGSPKIRQANYVNVLSFSSKQDLLNNRDTMLLYNIKEGPSCLWVFGS